MTLTAEQLEERRRGIGGSDAGAVLGLNPYRTPVAVWLEKTGRAEPEDLSDNEAVYWGNRLEDVVAEEFSRRTGLKVRRCNRTLTHPDLPFVIAHIDRQILSDGKRGPGVLEVKTAGQYAASKWGPSGTDQVPDEYLVQTAHYLAVTGYAYARLAVLIGGRDLRIYEIPRDEELIDLVHGQEERIWHGDVEADVPPPPVTVGDIETLYAVDDGETLLASAEIEDAARTLAEIKAQIKSLEEHASSLEERIKAAMRDYSVLVDAEGNPLVTWKKSKDSQRLDTKRLKEEQPEIWSRYSRTVPGSRWFLLKVKPDQR